MSLSRKFLLLLGAFLLASVTNFAWAADDFYANAHGGLALPGGEGADFIDDGFNLGGELGYRLQSVKHLRFSVSVDYLRHKGSDFANVGTLQLLTVLLNGYFDFYPRSALTPFLGFGVGYLHPFAEVEQQGNVLQGDGSDHVAYQPTAGISWRITQSLRFNVAYRFLAWSKDSGHSHVLHAGVDYYFK